MPRKFKNRRKRINKFTWFMVYTNDLVLITFTTVDNQSIGNKNNYFEGTKAQIRKEARDLNLDFSEWNKDKDSKDKI